MREQGPSTMTRNDGGLLELAGNRQMPDNARPSITLGELRAALATERRLTVARAVERYGLPGTADSIEDVHRDLATADVDEEAGNE